MVLLGNRGFLAFIAVLVAVVLGVLGFVGWFSRLSLDGTSLEGVLDHKVVACIDGGGVARSVLLVSPHGLSGEQWAVEAYRRGGIGGLLGSLAHNCSRVYCSFSVRLETPDPYNGVGPGGTLAYILDAGTCGEYFDRVDIGDRIVFRVSGDEPLRVESIVAISRP